MNDTNLKYKIILWNKLNKALNCILQIWHSVYWIEVSKPSSDYETPQRSHLPSTYMQCRVMRSNTRIKQLQLKYCRKFSLGTTQNLKAELDCQMLQTKATNDIKNRISGINPLMTSAIHITNRSWGLDCTAKGRVKHAATK